MKTENKGDKEASSKGICLEKSTLYDDDETGFKQESEESCQLGNYKLGEMFDSCATKSNIVLVLIKL